MEELSEISKNKFLNLLVPGVDDSWVEKIKFRQENRYWMIYSRKISLKCIRKMKDEDVTKEDLALKMGVTVDNITTYLSGEHNFDLKTLANLSEVLSISLI